MIQYDPLLPADDKDDDELLCEWLETSVKLESGGLGGSRRDGELLAVWRRLLDPSSFLCLRTCLLWQKIIWYSS